ncbi:MAG: tryptophan halogenase family protein [Acidobacteriota bacterium]
MAAVKQIGVIGGGTAGYFAAIALKRAAPWLRVTVVESSKIPIIGVGEATTPPMVPFLHRALGIDVVDFFATVQPTWKLGIKFLWGKRPHFCYPFGDAELAAAYAYEHDPDACSLTARLMAADRFPIVDSTFGPCSLLPELRFAYHLDNRRFVAYLAAHAKRCGVEHLDRTITDVVLDERGAIGELKTAEGDPVRFDLYIDATGFRSLLVGQALGSPFQSYASTLLCDRAVVADVPHGGHLKPYTLAETMDAGWCWAIPQVERDHRGYVYSSAFLDDAAAEAEMRRKNPGMTAPWQVKFRSGRLRDIWIHNAFAIGNAYGFVEPLESTALHMVILEVHALAGELARVAPSGGEPDRARLSRELGESWDYLRWFLGIHYRFNARLDTPFWRACRDQVDVSGIEDWLARYRAHGPLTAQGLAADRRDLVFGPRGVDVLLLGQDVPCPPPAPAIPPGAWQRRRDQETAAARVAWPQAKALELLRNRPDLLQELVDSPHGWPAALARELSSRSREEARVT